MVADDVFQRVRVDDDEAAVLEPDGDGLAIRGEGGAAPGLLEQLTVGHLVLLAEVPHPQRLVVTHRGTELLAWVGGEPPALTLTVTLLEMDEIVCLLLFYVPGTSTVISGCVPTCDSAHSW